MARTSATGIDIGSQNIRVVTCASGSVRGKNVKRIIGTGKIPSRGLRHGYVASVDEARDSISKAIQTAEQQAKGQIKRAYIGIGGIGLEAASAKGSVIISRGDSKITELDIDRAIEASERSLPESVTINKKILHTIPLQYSIDGKQVLGRADGMKGVKLEVETLFILSVEQHLNDLVRAVEESGIEVEDVIAAPFAASIVNLTKAEKIAGCVLVNIGGQTVSLVVYENGIPISLKIFPIGGTDITNDIALGLQIPLSEAESVKLDPARSMHPKRKLDEIMTARITDIFELIDTHLTSIGKNGLLPAGIIFTGGSTGIATLEDIARNILKLPTSIAGVSIGRDRGVIKDASWSVAYGLAVLGLSDDEERPEFASAKKTGGRILSFFKQYLP